MELFSGIINFISKKNFMYLLEASFDKLDAFYLSNFIIILRTPHVDESRI